MSANNYFVTRKKAYDLHEVSVTQANYTVRTGRVADGLQEDRVVNITTTSGGDDITITVPDGAYEGQRLLINLVTCGDDETVTVSTTTGDDATLGDTGDFVSYEWVNATSGWQTIHSQTD